MAKIAAMVFGVIFLIAGIWGFFSDSVVGFIAADRLSSIIHIIAGIALLVTAKKAASAQMLRTVGILYVIFAILGFINNPTVLFGTFATSAASNWFYLVVGVILTVLGFSGKKGMSSDMSSSAPMSTPPATPQM